MEDKNPKKWWIRRLKLYQKDSLQERVTKYRVACIIHECSQELVSHLINLGYDMPFPVDFEKHKEIMTYRSGYFTTSEHFDLDADIKKNWINCGTNKLLFLLLAGINNISYKNRVYIRKTNYWNVGGPRWGINTNEQKDIFFRTGWKEAMPEEIIACFADGTGDTIDDIECKEGNEIWFNKIKTYVREAGRDITYR